MVGVALPGGALGPVDRSTGHQEQGSSSGRLVRQTLSDCRSDPVLPWVLQRGHPSRDADVICG